MPIETLRAAVADELAQHFPVNSEPGIVICHCRARVAADPYRQGMREHLADAVLAVVEAARIDGEQR